MRKDKLDILYHSGLVERRDKIESINEDDEIIARQLEAEARLLDAFSRTVNSIKSMKHMISGNMGIPMGSDEMDSMKDAIQAKRASMMLRMKLRKMAYHKMSILKQIIDDVFGPSEQEEEGAREQEGPKETEYGEE